MKLVLSDPKTGKSYQVELNEDKRNVLFEKMIGDKIDGKIVDAEGYEFEITGGSDRSGFPMREDIYGERKVRAFLSGGVGYNPKKRGERKKKMVVGNTVSEEINQLNMKVVKYGSKKLDEMFEKKKENKEKKEQ